MKSKLIEQAQNGIFTLIAEIGVNYYDIAIQKGISPLDAAFLMIDEAKASGVHAVKFQTYKANTLASRNSPYYWDITEEPTRSQFELFQKFDSFNENEYALLSQHCNDKGIEFLSTAFDYESSDYLVKYMNVCKISSSDLTNLPFINHQALKGKPILLSVGASDADEIDMAVNEIRKVNQETLVLLHCVLEYPTPLEHANLRKITSLKERYPDVIIGYSDHTVPTDEKDVIKAAYLLGAVVVEKHFTLDKSLTGNDHYHAMDPSDARDILDRINKLNVICGDGALKSLETEESARLNARRSIVSFVAIGKGTVVTNDMLICKRPGTGIKPSEIDSLVGKKALLDVSEDTILQWDMFG